MKFIFLDIDGVFIPDKCKYLEFGRHAMYDNSDHWVSYDPFAVKFLNRLFDQNDDLYAVTQSTWRQNYPVEWLLKHFVVQGCNFRWHDDTYTNPGLERWLSIRNWLHEHPEISRDQIAILDDEKPPYDLQTRTVRVDEVNGLSLKNCQRLVSLLNLDWK